MKKFSDLFEKSDPCWKGYEMVGMKDKNGKKVPNCVPVKESLDEQIQMLDEMPGANMDTRAVHKHLKKQGWSLTRSSGGHDVFTHPEAKHHIPVPRHRQLKAPLVKGILKQSEVRKEEVEQLEEGRPSQRHPLEGHEYHRKSNAELEYIAKDAHKAAEAMKSHNTDAENKYRDQASDSATVRYYRQKHGMQPWYKKKYGHVNEEVVEEGLGRGREDDEYHVPDPQTHKFVYTVSKDSGEKHKRTVNVPSGTRSRSSVEHLAKAHLTKQGYTIHEDNVINTNSQNSLDGIKPATQATYTRKKQVIDRYTTGTSSAPSGTTVVASPRESVEIQEGRMKDYATDADFHPTVTNSNPPFDGPYKKKPKNVVDKSGAVHTPMSRVKNLAKQAARKNGGLKEENNDNTLSSYDKDDTPAKKTLSKTAGMVKDLATKAKEKAKTKKSDDTFQPEPELASNIVR